MTSLSETADFLYKTTDYSAPEHERCIVWNDPDIGLIGKYKKAQVVWKDQLGLLLKDADVFA